MIDLGQGVTFEPNESAARVLTRYSDGFECAATRDLTSENLLEVYAQGYLTRVTADEKTNRAALWRSLLEHELLHTLISRAIFCRESLVLRHESGAEQQRYALRLHEEALVLSYQRWLNLDEPDLVLWPYSALLAPLRSRLREMLG